MYDLALVNIFFEKNITVNIQEWEILISDRLHTGSEIYVGKSENGKVIPVESIAAQHRILVVDLNIQKQREGKDRRG